MSFSEPLNSRRSVRRRAVSLPRDYRERSAVLLATRFITHSSPVKIIVKITTRFGNCTYLCVSRCKTPHPFTQQIYPTRTTDMEKEEAIDTRVEIGFVRLKYSIESYVYTLIIPKGGRRVEGISWDASIKRRGGTCDVPFCEIFIRPPRGLFRTATLFTRLDIDINSYR